MGKRGPAPKPLEQRKAEGTYDRSKHGASVVIAGKVLELEPPDYLNEASAGVWAEIVPSLAESGLLDGVDSLALEALVTCVVTWRDAQAMIDRDGLIAHGGNGAMYQHPAVGIRNTAMREFRSWCQRFGLTPSDRVGLGIQALKGKGMQADLADRLGD